MLIVSKFRDFYDSVAYQKGVDKTLVYKRDKTEHLFDPDNKLQNGKLSLVFSDIKAFPHYESGARTLLNAKPGDYILNTFIIGFCGKIYPICKRTDFIKEQSYFYTKNVEAIDSYIYGMDKIKEQFVNTYTNKTGDWWKNRLAKELSYLEAYTKRNEVLELFYTYKCPILKITTNSDEIRNHKNLILNPCLKDIEFYKCMDTYQVFQELEMYIGGVLGINEVPTIEISEKDKVASKGFDKYSFRKDPGTKKRGKNK
jgi:hypothetical protein